MTTSLLPPNATVLEKALEDALGKPIEAIVAPLRELYQPEVIPEDFLPWLAWAVSTDVWDPDWPAEQKRALIAEMLELHRIKGTKAGIAGYLRAVGAELVDTLTPMDRPWALPDRAEAVTEAWKASLRQLRVYTRKIERDALPVEHFADHAYADHAYAWPDTPETVHGRRSFIYDPKTGVEEPMQRLTYDETRRTVEEDRTERSVIPARAGPHTPFTDVRFADYAFLVDQLEPEVLTTTVRESGEISTVELIVETLTPSLETTEIWPDRITVTIEKLQFYAADHAYADHAFAIDDEAELAYYDRWYLISRDTPPIDARPVGAYTDFTYTQPEPHTAYLYIRQYSKAHKGAGFADHAIVDHVFAFDDDLKNYNLAWDAVRASKAVADDISATFTSTLPLDLRSPIPLDGSVLFGSRRERRRL